MSEPPPKIQSIARETSLLFFLKANKASSLDFWVNSMTWLMSFSDMSPYRQFRTTSFQFRRDVTDHREIDSLSLSCTRNFGRWKWSLVMKMARFVICTSHSSKTLAQIFGPVNYKFYRNKMYNDRIFEFYNRKITERVYKIQRVFEEFLTSDRRRKLWLSSL